MRMVALYTVWYNFVKQHKTLKGLSPAMAAGLSDTLWSIADLAAVVDAAQPKASRRQESAAPIRKKFQTETLPEGTASGQGGLGNQVARLPRRMIT
jgi:hypothetical protein